MATLSITIPDAQAVRVMDAVAAQKGYSALLPDGSANPQTKAQFAKQIVIDYLKDAVRQYEIKVAMEAAQTTASQKVDTEVVLT